MSLLSSIAAGRHRFKAESLAFFSALSAQGLTLSNSKKAAWNTFLVSAAAHGYDSRLLEIYPFEGTSLAQQAVKLRKSGAYPATLTNNGLLSGDLLANGGFTSNSAAKYWLTGVNYNTINPLSFGMSVWNGSNIDRTASPLLIGSTNSVTPYGGLIAGGQTDLVTFRPTIFAALGGTVNASATVNQIGPGLYHVWRPSSTSLKSKANGLAVGTSATSVTNATKDFNFRVGAGHANGSVTILFAALDDGQMTDQQALDYARDVRVLLQSLGRVIKFSTPLYYSILVGQSLSTGTLSGTPISTTQPYTNRMHIGGVTNPSVRGALTNLTEFSLETPASGLANGLAAIRRAAVPGATDWDMALSGWGVGGTAYVGLKKGTTPYNNSLAAITDALAIAGATNTGMLVPFVPCVHGESDIASTTYATDIRQWQVDYETDIKAITGQTGTIPMLHSQPSAFGTGSTARSTYAILTEFRTNPTKTLLVGPKYIFTYSDGLHLVAASYRWMGEYYAKAAAAVMAGTAWSPLIPTSIVRSGAVITVSFAGRVGNLALDTTSVSDPGNYGFAWVQTGGAAQTISSVALINSNTQIQITLSGDPGTPTTQELLYAGPATGTSAGNAGGPTTGPRGCVRDSDPTVGPSGLALYNWLCHFRDPVT